MNHDKQVEMEEYLYEVETDKNLALSMLARIIGLTEVKVQELQSKSMVDGIKEDLVHNIKKQLNDALEWLEEYDKCVTLLLDEYGWQ